MLKINYFYMGFCSIKYSRYWELKLLKIYIKIKYLATLKTLIGLPVTLII